MKKICSQRMKTMLAGLTLILALPALADECADSFSKPPLVQLAPDADWRSSATQPSQSGQYLPTTPAREETLQRQKAQMEDFILNFVGEYGKGDIPWMRFVATERNNLQALSHSNGLGGIITRYKVSGIGPGGILKGTLLLPVSGHNGNENARKWAKSDVYTVNRDTNSKRVASTHSSWGHDGKEVALFRGQASKDLVTFQEVEITLEKDVPVVITYFRHGSVGVPGYIEGRVMEFIWDGT
jgi:hypothetical protein